MESGDASDEETALRNPKRTDLTQKEQSKVISILVALKTEDGLRRGAIMFVAKRFGVACCTIYQLWEQAESAWEWGIIYSPEFIS